MSRAPAYQWFPGDHQRDNALRFCSFKARALWRELLDLMHFGEPRGHLTAGSAPITSEEIARVVGLPVTEVRKLLAELEQRGVFSRTEEGVIFSRRMIRDEHVSQVRRAAGAKGGQHTAAENDQARRFAQAKAKQNGKQNAPPAVAVCSLQSATASTATTTSVADAPAVGEQGGHAEQAEPPAAQAFSLAPYIDMAREIQGDCDPPAGRWGKVFKRLEGKHGSEEVLRRWSIMVRDRGEWALRSPEDLATNWGRYEYTKRKRPGGVVARTLANMRDMDLDASPFDDIRPIGSIDEVEWRRLPESSEG